VLAVATWFAAQFSLTAVAWAVFGVFVLRFAVVMVATWIALERSVRDVLPTFTAAALVTASVAVSIGIVEGAVTMLAESRWPVLATAIAAGLLAQLAALRLTRRLFSPEVKALIQTLLGRLPQPVVPFAEAILVARHRT
jgi:lipid-A-disaccharide synthase-like uncharacterized protein